MKPSQRARREQLPAEECAPALTANRNPRPPLDSSTADAAGSVGVVVVDLHALKAAIREVLADMLTTSTAPEFYSQTSLPPGMTRRTFLDAIRRGDLPARASGKARLVARADYHAFIAKALPVRVRVNRQPAPANDVRALLRGSQGK